VHEPRAHGVAHVDVRVDLRNGLREVLALPAPAPAPAPAGEREKYCPNTEKYIKKYSLTYIERVCEHVHTCLFNRLMYCITLLLYYTLLLYCTLHAFSKQASFRPCSTVEERRNAGLQEEGGWCSYSEGVTGKAVEAGLGGDGLAHGPPVWFESRPPRDHDVH